MGWRSILFGFAAVVALCLGALAGDARRIIPFQLPARSQAPAVPRGPEGMEGQPRSVPPESGEPVEHQIAVAGQTATAGLRPSEDGMHRLSPGDTVHVTVLNDANLSGNFTIDRRGFVHLALAGQVPAAGLTASGLEGRIAAAFIAGGILSDPSIEVELVNDPPLYLIGDVAEPGDQTPRIVLTSP